MFIPSVTVCIPAYNEEANIKHLLLSILSQTTNSFVLEEIVVHSDGSTDNTVPLVRSIPDPRIVLHANSVRRGKVAIINDQLKAFSSDVLVQLDADIQLPDSLVLERLVAPFLEKPRPDFVCGMHWPLEPRTFVERLAYFGADCWESMKKQLGKKGDLHNSLGQIRAFSARFANKLVLPSDVGSFEDTYCFLFAKSKGYKVIVARDALVRFRLSSTYADYVKQMSRFVIVKEVAKRYFDHSLLKQHEHMTRIVKVKVFLRKMLEYPPHISLGYILLQTSVKLRAGLDASHKPLWDGPRSSKTIQ